MVPGSTLIYGSSFWIETSTPLLLSTRPIEAAVIPFPTDETTPPVKKMYLGIPLPLPAAASHLEHSHTNVTPTPNGASSHRQFRFGHNFLCAHFTTECLHRLKPVRVRVGDHAVVHRHHIGGSELGRGL